jgi:hypothetical protein
MALSALISSACAATYDHLEGPVIEMTNVDPAKHYRIQASAPNGKSKPVLSGRLGSSPIA